MKNENEKVIDKIIRKRCNKLFEIYIASEKETKENDIDILKLLETIVEKDGANYYTILIDSVFSLLSFVEAKKSNISFNEQAAFLSSNVDDQEDDFSYQDGLKILTIVEASRQGLVFSDCGENFVKICRDLEVATEQNIAFLQTFAEYGKMISGWLVTNEDTENMLKKYFIKLSRKYFDVDHFGLVNVDIDGIFEFSVKLSDEEKNAILRMIAVIHKLLVCSCKYEDKIGEWNGPDYLISAKDLFLEDYQKKILQSNVPSKSEPVATIETEKQPATVEVAKVEEVKAPVETEKPLAPTEALKIEEVEEVKATEEIKEQPAPAPDPVETETETEKSPEVAEKNKEVASIKISKDDPVYEFIFNAEEVSIEL